MSRSPTLALLKPFRTCESAGVCSHSSASTEGPPWGQSKRSPSPRIVESLDRAARTACTTAVHRSESGGEACAAADEGRRIAASATPQRAIRNPVVWVRGVGSGDTCYLITQGKYLKIQG